MESAAKRHPIHTFDIDTYLNRFVLRTRFDLLPLSISHWFGYRPPQHSSTPAPPSVSIPLVWLFSFLGGFIGIAIIENVFLALPLLDGAPVPIIVGSFGAAAILEYNTIESPLSQPRNLILGHTISAAIGVSITKLFLLLPHDRFMQLRWLAGALSVGTASTVMGFTKTIHPPAGATALLAATSPEILAVGWWLVALVLLASLLMLTSAMVVNNLYKRFPLYWWTPADLGSLKASKITRVKDVEKGDGNSETSLETDSDIGLKDSERKKSGVPDAEHHEILINDDERQQRKISHNPELEIRIAVSEIVVPDWMPLSQWEAEVLEGFQKRLREAVGN